MLVRQSTSTFTSANGLISQIFRTWLYFESFSISNENMMNRPSTLTHFIMLEDLGLEKLSVSGRQPLESLSNMTIIDFFWLIGTTFWNDALKESLRRT